MLTVACVLRSGGPYTADYVVRLRDAVSRHLSGGLHWRFVCLSNVEVDGLSTEPLITDWPGWWAKLELFRPGLLTPPVLYFDLDTVILRDITPLARMAAESEFMMLERFRFPGDCASGIMGWNREHSYLFHSLGPHGPSNPEAGDQSHISQVVRDRGTHIRRAQDAVPIYSYKNHVRKDERCVSDASVVCFHGRPRPHELAERGKPQWMEENWK